jgi:hypothetical protein
MSLVFDNDLDAWLSWQARQHRLRRLKGHVVDALRAPQQRWYLATGPEQPRVLVSMDTTNATAVKSVVAPLQHLGDVPIGIVAPVPLDGVVDHLDLQVRPISPGLVDGLVERARCVVTAGHYLPVGLATAEAARRYDRPLLMVQHGALTPYAPPLPEGCTLLAWSEADGAFWAEGTASAAVEVVGSQLLWEAAVTTLAPHHDQPLTYLGQGHAAELPRPDLVRAAFELCRRHDAIYRPHPSERDKASRLVHAGYRRAGIAVDASIPLSQLDGPVVSVFSTGVLEAAAQGRRAWVDFPNPPEWLAEFWDRYGMSRLGDDPTPSPHRSAVAPAEQIARAIEEVIS